MIFLELMKLEVFLWRFGEEFVQVMQRVFDALTH